MTWPEPFPTSGCIGFVASRWSVLSLGRGCCSRWVPTHQRSSSECVKYHRLRRKIMHGCLVRGVLNDSRCFDGLMDVTLPLSALDCRIMTVEGQCYI